MPEKKKVLPFPQARLQPKVEPMVFGSHRGLKLVVAALIRQVGPVGAHNALADAANEIRDEVLASPSLQSSKD